MSATIDFDELCKSNHGIVVTPSGETSIVQPTNGRSFELDQVRELIGCKWIEIVRTNRHGLILLCDEEFLLKSDPARNEVGCSLYGPPNDPGLICGTILICRKGMVL